MHNCTVHIRSTKHVKRDCSTLQISLHGDRSYFHNFKISWNVHTPYSIYYFVYPNAVGYFTIYLPCQAVAEYVLMIHVAWCASAWRLMQYFLACLVEVFPGCSILSLLLLKNCGEIVAFYSNQAKFHHILSFYGGFLIFHHAFHVSRWFYACSLV